MSISSVIQKGKQIFVYNENGATIWTGFGELKGYTSNTYTYESGGTIQTYDESRRLLSNVSAH